MIELVVGRRYIVSEISGGEYIVGEFAGKTASGLRFRDYSIVNVPLANERSITIDPKHVLDAEPWVQSIDLIDLTRTVEIREVQAKLKGRKTVIVTGNKIDVR